MKKYSQLSNRLLDLENDIISALRKEVKESKTESVHIQGKAIRVNIYNYTELVIVNGGLTFIDENGLQYNLFASCTLNDLTEILQRI
jgi:hypothetical protein